MAEPLDHIIFVGFPIPDENTPAGENAYRHIMDAANVNRDKIFFYPENTSIPNIIRGTFTLDKSEKYNYRIGNSLCIGSDNVGATYRHQLELLDKKVEIPVKTGYEHVDLSTMSEAEISYWLSNGRYKEIRSLNDDDDLISGLLGGEVTEYEEDQEPDNSFLSREDLEHRGVLLEPTEEDLEYRSAFQQDPENEIDFEDLMGSVDDSNKKVSESLREESSRIGITTHDQPAVTEDEVVVDREEPTTDEEVVNVDDDFDAIFNEASQQQHTAPVNHDVPEVENDDDEFSLDDLFDDDPVETPAQPVQETTRPTPELSPEPVNGHGDVNHRPEPVRRSETPSSAVNEVTQDEDDLLDDLFGDVEDTPAQETVSRPASSIGLPTEDIGAVPDNREDTPSVKDDPVEIPIDDIDIPDDDMEYVRRAERNRLRAEKRAEEDRRRREELDRLTSEEQGIGAIDEDMFRDEFGESANQMRQKAEHAVESRYTKDGRPKNYRDYLTEDEAKSQRIAERTKAKFGEFDIDYDESAKEGDLKYVGEGTGRIILCTSGKGGVGKSLVANGLAMALSLARAKEAQSNPGANTARTWLIESDYNSPHLAMAFKTGKKNIGNIAQMIAGRGKAVDRSLIRKAIEENVFVDPETGIHVLACPPLSSRKSSKEIPFAILLAVKYASDHGDDVIIDHGNLTSGEYSELDQVLSLQLAHRVVMVSSMGCIPETQSALQILCDRERNSVVPARPVPSVSVVLNSAREEQFTIAQDKLRPFEIINMIPPIDAFRAENSLEGSTYLPDAPKEVQKAVMDRCGIMLTKLGYESMRKYFSVKSSFNVGKKSEGNNIIKRLANFLARD